ncbi:MAG: hypothetical protein HY921_04405 [Elusimicrobia bacterium]|nr:hypothetical protein [Elusimicrobiota bacterium]
MYINHKFVLKTLAIFSVHIVLVSICRADISGRGKARLPAIGNLNCSLYDAQRKWPINFAVIESMHNGRQNLFKITPISESCRGDSTTLADRISKASSLDICEPIIKERFLNYIQKKYKKQFYGEHAYYLIPYLLGANICPNKNERYKCLSKEWNQIGSSKQLEWIWKWEPHSKDGKRYNRVAEKIKGAKNEDIHINTWDAKFKKEVFLKFLSQYQAGVREDLEAFNRLEEIYLQAEITCNDTKKTMEVKQKELSEKAILFVKERFDKLAPKQKKQSGNPISANDYIKKYKPDSCENRLIALLNKPEQKAAFPYLLRVQAETIQHWADQAADILGNRKERLVVPAP